MIKHMTLNNFRDEFADGPHKNRYTYEGLEIIYNYLEYEYPEIYDEEFKFDIEEVATMFEEYENVEEVNAQWNETYEDIDELQKYAEVYIKERGDNGFVVIL